jgi:hypothetical protein
MSALNSSVSAHNPVKTIERSGVHANRWLGALFVLEAVLSFLPLLILGPAIGWPASLRHPADAQLLAIAAKPDAVRWGYSIYLLYSVLIAPVAVLVAARVCGLRGTFAAMIVSFGALSALARVVGILRWLTVMPVMAGAYATSDASARAMIETVFIALNSYGGGIGELLGVALFGGLWLLLAMIAALRTAALPRWLVGFGILAAALQLALCLPTVGIAITVPIAAAVTVFALWLIAFGVHWSVAKHSSQRG